jgi:hypothetical protein
MEEAEQRRRTLKSIASDCNTSLLNGVLRLPSYCRPGQLPLVRRACPIVTATLILSACGAVWDSGGERHALGIGYVAWPMPAENNTTVVQGVDVVGAGLLATQSEIGIVVGYNSERSVKLDNNEVVTLDCLKCDLAGARPSAAAGR